VGRKRGEGGFPYQEEGNHIASERGKEGCLGTAEVARQSPQRKGVPFSSEPCKNRDSTTTKESEREEERVIYSPLGKGNNRGTGRPGKSRMAGNLARREIQTEAMLDAGERARKITYNAKTSISSKKEKAKLGFLNPGKANLLVRRKKAEPGGGENSRKNNLKRTESRARGETETSTKPNKTMAGHKEKRRGRENRRRKASAAERRGM